MDLKEIRFVMDFYDLGQGTMTVNNLIDIKNTWQVGKLLCRLFVPVLNTYPFAVADGLHRMSHFVVHLLFVSGNVYYLFQVLLSQATLT